MGGSTASVPVTPEIIENVCKYQKDDFNNKIEVLRDSHALMQYYANLLLGETMQQVKIILITNVEKKCQI
jgi:hypothetical protein